MTDDLIFQEVNSEMPENTCRLVQEEEEPPGTITCFRVEICGSPPRNKLIHIQAGITNCPGLVVGDSLGHMS